MPLRVLTVFRGPTLETKHDTATGRITTPGGHSLPCTLEQFLRSANREAKVHRELGWPYRVGQWIEEEEDA